MTRRINSETENQLKEWEDLVLYAYDDADRTRPKRRIKVGDKVRGELTIGYGHTGPDVYPGMEITESQAITLLRKDLARFERAVDTSVKVPLHDCQFGALVSFAFNVGVEAFKGSTLLKRLNKGEYGAVPYELLKWVKDGPAGKKVTVQGLVNRRNKEIGMWAGGSNVAPASTTTPEPIKKPVLTKESVTWGAGVAATVTAGGSTIFDGAGPIQWVLAAVILIAFSIGAYLFLKKRI